MNLFEWNWIGNETSVMKITLGWIFRSQKVDEGYESSETVYGDYSMVYIPDPDHEMEGDLLRKTND
jgi:hypothetical protein